MGTANIILTAQPTTILQPRHPRTIISNEGAVTAYLDDQSSVTADVNDFVLRPGERIAWAENVPCWAVGNGATISTSQNVERFSTPSPDDWLRYVNSIPPAFPPYVPPSDPVPVVTGGLVKVGATIAISSWPFALPVGTFTATYDDYLLRLRLNTTTVAAGSIVGIRLSAGGVVDSTAGHYDSVRTLIFGGSVSVIRNEGGTTLWDRVAFCGIGSPAIQEIVLSNPFTTEPTIISDYGTGWYNTTGNVNTQLNGRHSQHTQYDACQFVVNSGVPTGVLTVFGFER